MNLAPIPSEQFEYLLGVRGVPDYYREALIGLDVTIEMYLAGEIKKSTLRSRYDRVRFAQRADAVSRAVRASYLAELKGAAA